MTKKQKQEAFDKAGLTQSDLARLAGVTQPNISHWLRSEPKDCMMYYCIVYKIERFINEYLKKNKYGRYKNTGK